MNRNLDGIYFRIERNGKFENVCFSDMTEAEQRENECMAANIKLVEQNAQLKELLKECKEIFDECFSPSAKHGELYKKIDEALR